MKEKILLFIPMYNCEKQITRVLGQLNDEVSEYLSEVIIVNNRSTDNGEQAVMDYLKNTTVKVPVKLLRNCENYGLGGSHKVAFHYAVEKNFDYVIVLHGDDQGSIKDLLPLIKDGSFRKSDCCLGARFMKGSKLEGYSSFRTFGNLVYNILFSISVGRNIKDLGAGLNMYSTAMLKNNFFEMYPDNLTFNCYMLFALREYKQSFQFFPITWREDDQVSNVKMVKQAMFTFKIAMGYFFKRGKFLANDARVKAIKKYEAEEVFSSET